MKSKNMKVLSGAFLVAGLFTSVSFGAAQKSEAADETKIPGIVTHEGLRSSLITPSLRRLSPYQVAYEGSDTNPTLWFDCEYDADDLEDGPTDVLKVVVAEDQQKERTKDADRSVPTQATPGAKKKKLSKRSTHASKNGARTKDAVPQEDVATEKACKRTMQQPLTSDELKIFLEAAHMAGAGDRPIVMYAQSRLETFSASNGMDDGDDFIAYVREVVVGLKEYRRDVLKQRVRALAQYRLYERNRRPGWAESIVVWN